MSPLWSVVVRRTPLLFDAFGPVHALSISSLLFRARCDLFSLWFVVVRETPSLFDASGSVHAWSTSPLTLCALFSFVVRRLLLKSSYV